MILPDVNLLIYACRRDVPLHRVSRSWLDSTIESEARFAISKLTLSAFVRIATNSRAYRIPTSLTDAFAFCDNLLGQPHCEVIEPGEGHWDIFRRLCIATNTRGNDLADACMPRSRLNGDASG